MSNIKERDSSKNNTRIVKNMQMLYVRLIFNMIVTLYTSRIILNALGIEDFGLYGVVGGVVTFFTFLNGAMAAATQRYLTFELVRNNIDDLRKIFSTSINIHLLIGLFIFLLGETIGLWFVNSQLVIPEHRIYAANWVYQFAIFSCVLSVSNIPYNAAIIAREKMAAFAYISILETVLKLLAAFSLIWILYDKLIIYAFLLFVIQFLIRVIYNVYCVKNFSETKFKFLWNNKLIKEMSAFAGWTMIGSLSYIGYTQGVNVLLNIFFGPTVNAARSISVQVQTAILAFSRNIQQAINPQITKSYASSDFEYMHTLVFNSSKYSFFLLYLISLPLFLEIDLILKWWLGNVPEYTNSFIRIIIVISLIDSLANPMIISVHATGRIRKFQIIEGFILLLIVPTSYFVLKSGGNPNSVFIVHLIIAVLVQFIRIKIACPMIMLKYKEYIDSVIYPILRVFTISCMLPLITYFFLPTCIFSFILVIITSSLSIIATIYFRGMNLKERKALEQLIKNKFLKSM